ncbi:sodium/hydrogen exchanger 5 isoform X2 [Physcomitrium patens]|uniref:sodium/hydrogen exchanger 5 isoform X2 n=1 Tax=Physcomitrium patens TaxID=3218 RepID=UPI003CCE21D2
MNSTMKTTSEPPKASLEEQASNVPSLSILLQTTILGFTFVVGHIMRQKNILIIHEAGIALLLGVFVGLMITLMGDNGFKTWINFNNHFFFYVLLPPIIFDSGWSLKPSHFFSNFGAICTFAFLGTIISTFVIGVLLWMFGFMGWTYSMPFLVSLTFGALISATDPVTVLAIFNVLEVDADLKAYVFGESVLNDAVAIVTYRLTTLEVCLVVLFPYASYMLADGLNLSGIVAILFAGIGMRYYTAPNLSLAATQLTTSFFQMLAKLSETFVFIYMGVAMFLEQLSWHSFGFTFFTIISCLIARIANIYPCSWLINLRRPISKKIPTRFQHALWFSGLRGAMAFALASQSVVDLPKDYGRIYLTSTLFTIFFTVLFIGGSTAQVLKYLEIEFHVSKDDVANQVSNKNEDEEEQELENIPIVENKMIFSTISQKHKTILQNKLQKFEQAASFAKLDEKYIKPFLAPSSLEGSIRSTKQQEGLRRDES